MPEETLSRPWADIIELLEARSRRMDRSNEKPANVANVTYSENLAEFGLGMG